MRPFGVSSQPDALFGIIRGVKQGNAEYDDEGLPGLILQGHQISGDCKILEVQDGAVAGF